MAMFLCIYRVMQDPMQYRRAEIWVQIKIFYVETMLHCTLCQMGGRGFEKRSGYNPVAESGWNSRMAKLQVKQ